MKISDGLKQKGKPFEIPDCGRDDLPELFKEMKFKQGAEIGVYMGEFSETLSQSGLLIYSIDPWLSFDEEPHPGGQKRCDQLYEISRKRLEPYPNNVIMRKTSMEALDDFSDNSLDFVYIDANHHFPYVAEDIFHWSYKVKKGGIICGHDYAPFTHRYVGGGCQVKEIIDAFSKAYDLDFWILGRFRKRKGEKRDRFRSWLFIKTWDNMV